MTATTPDPMSLQDHYLRMQEELAEQREANRNTRSRFARRNRLIKAMKEAYQSLDWHRHVTMAHDQEMALFADAVLDLLDIEGEEMLPRERP